MKFRHLEYFVAAAEELNFTHATRIGCAFLSHRSANKSTILKANSGWNFERQRKGVALTPADKSTDGPDRRTALASKSVHYREDTRGMTTQFTGQEKSAKFSKITHAPNFVHQRPNLVGS
jgi:hypothetical protein